YRGMHGPVAFCTKAVFSPRNGPIPSAAGGGEMTVPLRRNNAAEARYHTAHALNVRLCSPPSGGPPADARIRETSGRGLADSTSGRGRGRRDVFLRGG